MGAAGNKQPKKEKSSKQHGKHVPSYQSETPKTEVDDFKKTKWLS